MLTVFGVIAVLGFEQAIPIAASEAELANLPAISGVTLTATTGIVALAAGLLSDQALHVIWLGQLVSDPLGFACLAGYYVMVAAATRAGAFRDIAATRISQGLSGPPSQIGLGLLAVGAPGLVIGQSSGIFLLFSRVILRSPGGPGGPSHGAA